MARMFVFMKPMYHGDFRRPCGRTDGARSVETITGGGKQARPRASRVRGEELCLERAWPRGLQRNATVISRTRVRNLERMKINPFEEVSVVLQVPDHSSHNLNQLTASIEVPLRDRLD